MPDKDLVYLAGMKVLVTDTPNPMFGDSLPDKPDHSQKFHMNEHDNWHKSIKSPEK